MRRRVRPCRNRGHAPFASLLRRHRRTGPSLGAARTKRLGAAAGKREAQRESRKDTTGARMRSADRPAVVTGGTKGTTDESGRRRIRTGCRAIGTVRSAEKCAIHGSREPIPLHLTKSLATEVVSWHPGEPPRRRRSTRSGRGAAPFRLGRAGMHERSAGSDFAAQGRRHRHRVDALEFTMS